MDDDGLTMQTGHYRSRRGTDQPDGTATLEVEIDEGPWGVYGCYCLTCSYRYISVAPVSAEAVDLWECSKGCGMTVSWHPYEGDA